MMLQPQEVLHGFLAANLNFLERALFSSHRIRIKKYRASNEIDVC